MSMTPPTEQQTVFVPPAAEVRGAVSDTFHEPRPVHKETKASFATTEFWAMLAGIAALIVLYNVRDDASLNLWRTCVLATAIGCAYMLSRGLAKSGSHIQRWDDNNRRR
ncbi:MAG: hypothetical protein JWN62_409 [Acidimicrobiales bacterium]|nr:hypothetical protein [Acidimicrobiales bacterium]